MMDVIRNGFQVSGPLVQTPSPLIPSPCAERMWLVRDGVRWRTGADLSLVKCSRAGRRWGKSGEEALGELPFSPVHPLGFPAHQESKERETASLLILVDLSCPQGLMVSGKAL